MRRGVKGFMCVALCFEGSGLELKRAVAITMGKA